MTSLQKHLQSIASKGGKARAAKLTPKRRLEISQNANKAKAKSPNK